MQNVELGGNRVYITRAPSVRRDPESLGNRLPCIATRCHGAYRVPSPFHLRRDSFIFLARVLVLADPIVSSV